MTTPRSAATACISDGSEELPEAGGRRLEVYSRIATGMPHNCSVRNTFLHFHCDSLFVEEGHCQSIHEDVADKTLFALVVDEATAIGLDVPEWSLNPLVDDRDRPQKSQRDFVKRVVDSLSKARLDTSRHRRVAARHFAMQFQGRSQRVFGYGLTILASMFPKGSSDTHS